MITNIIEGDLIKLAIENEFDVIVHGCNCFNTMGAGIARQIREKLPEAYIVDQQTISGDTKKLGLFTQAYTKHNFVVVNAYTQYECGTDKMNVDYDAIRQVFKSLDLLSIRPSDQTFRSRMGIPMIGAGLAGGDWDVISKIINEATPNLDITLVKYGG